MCVRNGNFQPSFARTLVKYSSKYTLSPLGAYSQLVAQKRFVAPKFLKLTGISKFLLHLIHMNVCEKWKLSAFVRKNSSQIQFKVHVEPSWRLQPTGRPKEVCRSKIFKTHRNFKIFVAFDTHECV